LLREFEVPETLLVRIKLEKPEGVVYKYIKKANYPEFLEEYPKEAILKGFIISEIKVIKEYKTEKNRS
jgi:hypothetical protein